MRVVLIIVLLFVYIGGLRIKTGSLKPIGNKEIGAECEMSWDCKSDNCQNNRCDQGTLKLMWRCKYDEQCISSFCKQMNLGRGGICSQK